MSTGDSDREDLADLIAPHDAYHVNEDGWTVCICGHVAVEDDDDGSHARHLADVLVAGFRRPATGDTLTDWALTLDDTQRIVDHLIHDGTRDGLILGDLLNSAMGASARRRATTPATGDTLTDTEALVRDVAKIIHRFDCEWCDECSGPNFNDTRLARQIVERILADRLWGERDA